ncbi:hypothetical protein OIDMADRAFT_48910 [Oidiodendron maius Zn]|uniref:Uncharacterized protein n=1 Tax=Oidiodendron maius (strain Zn) TaxID=913774 RepID=A0A0C3I3X2_OIDMZ|nr:hypothetical protein OIDMADRAFT_48910 [Oidiodendron maius Zn]
MSAVTIIAIGAIIEPIVAGPALGIARAVGTGLQVASAVGSSNKGSNHKREITEDQIDFLFRPCFRSSKMNEPTINYDTDTKSGDITSLSAECMEAFEVYKEEINPEELGHARVRKTGPASVHVDEIPPQFLNELEAKFSKPSALPATKPAS